MSAVASLTGQRSFVFDASNRVDAEVPRNAKGWVERQMSRRAYRETTDQPAFTARMDLHMAREGSRSFRKLCSEWQKMIGSE